MSASNQPDWNSMAEKFDMWLPQIAPVGDLLIEALDVKPGDKVLDVASGTGEPALTLARQTSGHVRIIGTDAAPAMAKVANAKVVKEHLKNIEFMPMPAEKLEFPENHFDKILCRFGVMLFEDSQQGLNQMCRVLKPGGRFALAVWSTPETMPIMKWSYEAFKGKIPEHAYPPLEKMTSVGAKGVLDELLRKAGFKNFKVEKKILHYRFDSFDQYWDTVEATDVLKMQFDALPSELRHTIRDEVRRFAEAHISEHGLAVPHEYLMAVGSK